MSTARSPVEEIESAEANELASRFRSSDLGRRAETATRIEREFDFLFETDDVIVRGQIDLWFEEAGELVIVDYKTDRDEIGARGLRAAIAPLRARSGALRGPPSGSSRAVLSALEPRRRNQLKRCRSGCGAKRGSGVKTGAGSASVSVESWGAVQEVLVLGRGL